MKKVVGLLVFATLCLWPAQASAHVLKSDGQIGAVMHIDPDDDPIAGASSNFYFDIKDKQSKFTPDGCDCQFTVSENAKQLYSQPLFQNSNQATLSNALVSYTFSDIGVYQVSITGKPKTAAGFQNFRIVYDVRVDRSVVASTAGAGTPAANNHTGIFIAVAAVAVVLFGLLLALSFKKSKHPEPPESDDQTIY